MFLIRVCWAWSGGYDVNIWSGVWLHGMVWGECLPLQNAGVVVDSDVGGTVSTWWRSAILSLRCEMRTIGLEENVRFVSMNLVMGCVSCSVYCDASMMMGSSCELMVDSMRGGVGAVTLRMSSWRGAMNGLWVV